jgi:hypothetical protein
MPVEIPIEKLSRLERRGEAERAVRSWAYPVLIVAMLSPALGCAGAFVAFGVALGSRAAALVLP